MGDQRLRPTERLRRPGEFQRVFRHGTRLEAAAFILYMLPGAESHSRLGMAVSKRVGKAVVRNRIKRYVRELFRRHKTRLQPPCDLVFVARRHAAQTSAAEFTRQFLTLLRRARLAAE